MVNLGLPPSVVLALALAIPFPNISKTPSPTAARHSLRSYGSNHSSASSLTVTIVLLLPLFHRVDAQLPPPTFDACSCDMPKASLPVAGSGGGVTGPGVVDNEEGPTTKV